MTMTAVYHLGYSQYREDAIGAPETGNTIISMPMLLTTNPIGSVVDHAAMHISAVAHSYETEVRLPPPPRRTDRTPGMAARAAAAHSTDHTDARYLRRPRS